MEQTHKQYRGWEITWWTIAALVSGLGGLLKLTAVFYVGVALVLSFFFYRFYVEWKAGDNKAVRSRIITLIIALILGVIAYWYCSR